MALPRYTKRYTFACTPEQRETLDQLEHPADWLREAIDEKLHRERSPEEACVGCVFPPCEFHPGDEL